MILSILLHPFTLIVALIVSVVIIRDLVGRGSSLFAVQDRAYAHLELMAKPAAADAAWESLSYDLKARLNDERRLKKGKDFVGLRRLTYFMKLYAKLYSDAKLTIDSVSRVGRVAPPKEMYMVRLRSQQSGVLRMTLWLTRVPFRADGWSVAEICVHPESGNVYQGETLTGAPMRGRPSRLKQKLKDRARKRGDRDLARANAAERKGAKGAKA
jgi:hypothetical protein